MILSPEIDRDYVLSLLQDLVRINSVNPMASQGGRLNADAPGEGAVAERIAGELKRLGCEVKIQTIAEGRPNVIGTLRRKGKTGPRLVLCSHMDTVEVGEMEGPFSGAYREGRVFGRGALDCKGQLAAYLGAIEAVVREKSELPVDLVLAAVCDEEDQSIGAQALLNEISGDFCLVGEPTNLDIVIAHKGFFWVDIETFGKAVHGSAPEEGIDAIAKMAAVIGALEELKGRLKERAHPLLGYPRLHMGVIRGGSGPSTVPDRCHLTVEVRTCGPEEAKEIFRLIEETLSGLSRRDATLKAKARLGVVRHPMEIAPHHPLVLALRAATEEATQRSPELKVMGAWTDAAFLSQKMPTAVFGAGDLSLAHAKEESISLDEVVAAARTYLALAHILPEVIS